MLHKLADAIRQGLAAHREYERLMSMGMRHDLALKAALSMPTATTDRPIANSRALSGLIARPTPLMRTAPRADGIATPSVTNAGFVWPCASSFCSQAPGSW